MKADRASIRLSPMAHDVAIGLTATPKWLSAKYFYDAAGSALFEEITRLPEYYLTATECSIFHQYAREMLTTAGDDLSVLELGAGSAAKSIVLLRELQKRQDSVRFVPIDVSESALDEAVARVGEELPDVLVTPAVMDYTEGLDGVGHAEGRKLVLYIGSSIGNFEPFQAGALLGKLRCSLNSGDAILLGTDMRKPASILIPAYDDSQGVTAAFNKNILSHINRELGADFDLDAFAHRAVWNSNQSRIEMHLESLSDQTVNIVGLRRSIHFREGETIHTENSYKFTMPMLEAIADNGGFRIEQTWSDSRGWFTVHLLRA
jgi:dimethylhistidine N-methyltransferase